MAPADNSDEAAKPTAEKGPYVSKQPSEAEKGRLEDLEADETREELARRLCARRANTLAEATKLARRQFGRHVRHLSDDQRRSLAAWLRRDFEHTLKVIEDADREAPPFSFVPDFAADL